MRKLSAMLACLFLGLALVSAAQPNQDRLTGSWKVTFLDSGDLLTFWVVKLETKDGKLNGTIDVVPKAPPGKLSAVALKDDKLTANFDFNGMPMVFVVNVSKAPSKQLSGTMTFQGNTYPAQFEATKDDSAKDLEWIAKVDVAGKDFKALKEDVAKRSSELAVYPLASAMVTEAIMAKAPPADLKAALEPALKAARTAGNFHQETLLKFARILASREDYAALGEEYVQQALKEVGPTADASTQLKCFDILATSFEKQNKKNELTTIRTKIDEMENKGHEENEKAGLGFDPAKFDGRKGKHVALVELFTGAQCPPCVAADLAFEGLAKTYTNKEVVLLQYHLHIPGPDPMTTPDTESRAKYYGVGSTPTILFNGKGAAPGGGGKAAAGAKYNQYRQIIDPILTDDNTVKLTLDAVRIGDAISINSSASNYKPSEKLKLRFALIEPWVRYPGRNGLEYHVHVVRALPGGVEGFTLDKENVKKSVKVSLAEIRQLADRHLQKVDGFLQGQRTFSYRNLRVVAFVQDDETKEVLHAVETPVK